MTALIWCPFPDRDQAAKAANDLLDSELIACANILGPMESIYSWNGDRCHADEIGVIFKTRRDILTECVERLGKLHPYDSPAILGWECDKAHPSTQEWLLSLGA